MPNAARKGDLSTGHHCYPPSPNIEASDNVLINGLGAQRIGDAYKKHCCHSCHDGVLSSGSSKVFINGKGAGRVRDFISCGGKVLSGSDNVFIG